MIVKLNGNEFFRVTEPFGAINNIHPTAHTGIDLATYNLTPLPSVSDGVVEKVYHLGSYNIGNGIKIETPEGHDIIYGHLSEVLVKEGQHVELGQIIGKAGSSGHSTGYHLHLGEKIDDKFVDPSNYVDILQQLAHNLLDTSWSTVQCVIHFI